MTELDFPSISLGFPVYNEEVTLGEVLGQAHKLLSNSNLDYEILVCNDGSTDHSLDIIEKIASQFPNFRVINHEHNLGIFATFEHIYREAKKDLVFINSVDKQWDTAILFGMLPLIKEGDIIIASRKRKSYGLFRNFISWVFNMAPLCVFGVNTFDAGAVKLMKREIIERFPLTSKSPFSEAERLIRSSLAGYRIINYPVDTSPRRSGRSHGVNLGVLFNASADVLRLWNELYCRRKKCKPR